MDGDKFFENIKEISDNVNEQDYPTKCRHCKEPVYGKRDGEIIKVSAFCERHSNSVPMGTGYIKIMNEPKRVDSTNIGQDQKFIKFDGEDEQQSKLRKTHKQLKSEKRTFLKDRRKGGKD